MRDKGAVAGQVFHKELQLLQHFPLGKRGKRAALRFLQQRRTRKQRQSAGADQHGVALAEDLRRVNGVATAVFFPRDAVQKGHPVGDAGFVQLMALLNDIRRVVALVDAFQRPIVAALHAERDLADAQLFHSLELLHRFVPNVGHAGCGIDVFNFRQILTDQLQIRQQAVIAQRQRVCAEKLDGRCVRRDLRQLMQILLDPLQRLHLELHVPVHRTKLAAVMCAALRDLQQWECRPVGVAVYGSGKMHDVFPLTAPSPYSQSASA